MCAHNLDNFFPSTNPKEEIWRLAEEIHELDKEIREHPEETMAEKGQLLG
jgi:hypothetical protein